MNLPEEIQTKLSCWTKNPFDQNTVQELQTLINKKDETALVDRFYRELEFGTGGMRGVVGAGTNRINIYNIRKATYALSQHVKSVFSSENSPLKESLKKSLKGPLKIAISYDSRAHSKLYAKTCAEVLAAYGIEVLITKEMRPVPMLSYMVRHFKCHAGICITASHNPPEYNGFKVYWQDGGQLIPPHDKAISALYNNQNSLESIAHMDFDLGVSKGLITYVLEELDTAYFQALESIELLEKGEKSLKILYTPLHGSGLFSIPRALKQLGFKDTFICKEQASLLGDFPTIKSPNPENQESMKIAIAEASRIGADLVLASDPDADRIGMAYRKNDTWCFLNGNQMGCLLLDFILEQLSKNNKLPKNALVVNSIVTTDLQEKIARSYNTYFEQTLTGFKWICEKAEQIKKQGKDQTFICGLEESYGFLFQDFVRDKDATIGAMLLAQLFEHLKNKNSSFENALDNLYLKHGYYLETLYNLELPGIEGSKKITEIMNLLRSQKILSKFSNTFLEMKDYKEQIITKENLSIVDFLTQLPKSDVLAISYSKNIKVIVRPSGTEPKMKLYFSIFDIPKNHYDLEFCKQNSKEKLELFQKNFLENLAIS